MWHQRCRHPNHPGCGLNREGYQSLPAPSIRPSAKPVAQETIEVAIENAA